MMRTAVFKLKNSMRAKSIRVEIAVLNASPNTRYSGVVNYSFKSSDDGVHIQRILFEKNVRFYLSASHRYYFPWIDKDLLHRGCIGFCYFHLENQMLTLSLTPPTDYNARVNVIICLFVCILRYCLKSVEN